MVEIKLLERIAEYYEFPMAVFFTEDAFKGKTRNKVWQEKAEKYDKILEIIENERNDTI